MKTSARERGLALVCALVLMLAAMLIGVAVPRVFAAIACWPARRARPRIGARPRPKRPCATPSATSPARPRRRPTAQRCFGPAGAGASSMAAGAAGRPRAVPGAVAAGMADARPGRRRQPGARALRSLTPARRWRSGAGMHPRGAGLPHRKIAPPGATAAQGSFYRDHGDRLRQPGLDAGRAAVVVRLPPAAGGAGRDHGQGDESDEGHDNGNDGAHGGDPSPAQPPRSEPPGRRLPAGRIGWREIATGRSCTPGPRPMTKRGFTLIEMLVVLVIVCRSWRGRISDLRRLLRAHAPHRGPDRPDRRDAAAGALPPAAQHLCRVLVRGAGTDGFALVVGRQRAVECYELDAHACPGADRPTASRCAPGRARPGSMRASTTRNAAR
jgi:type IV pilus assembly protein PilX